MGTSETTPIAARLGRDKLGRISLILGFPRQTLKKLRQRFDIDFKLGDEFYIRGEKVHRVYMFCEDTEEAVSQRMRAICTPTWDKDNGTKEEGYHGEF